MLILHFRHVMYLVHRKGVTNIIHIMHCQITLLDQITLLLHQQNKVFYYLFFFLFNYFNNLTNNK
jgi:hypothetical protein